jgi:hypothetical protein
MVADNREKDMPALLDFYYPFMLQCTPLSWKEFVKTDVACKYTFSIVPDDVLDVVKQATIVIDVRFRDTCDSRSIVYACPAVLLDKDERPFGKTTGWVRSPHIPLSSILDLTVSVSGISLF